MIDHEEEAYKLLTGKYKHYCLEYDGLAIDETCVEFENCLCFDNKPLPIARHAKDPSPQLSHTGQE